ncbi:hypothetical protein [Rummeliibacillus stabekisii]|uniref:hypothetical protein n=1 Tax=Rummeliibacillus stabekisii TaxID=241244 RepID=UPI00116E803E|nr:hypothetical protein [Rummeliibacillus stabekisii]MBB5169242.1 hypothetical protein [Rummeliibacillus stabekisii]GEL03503.1 hypothetical protein RST01_01300 [Rummeliibacillus stabekisii]
MEETKMETYFNTKDIAKRNALLKQIVFDLPEQGKDFFLKAYKKERYLDMRLTAIRGYSAFASEEEVAVLINKMLEILKKRSETTPYNYEEYEILRSAFLMPYLVEKYPYDCFKKFNEQLEKQYHIMPDVFKGIFTCNDKGEHIQLIPPAVARKQMEGFLRK